MEEQLPILSFDYFNNYHFNLGSHYSYNRIQLSLFFSLSVHGVEERRGEEPAPDIRSTSIRTASLVHNIAPTPSTAYSALELVQHLGRGAGIRLPAVDCRQVNTVPQHGNL